MCELAVYLKGFTYARENLLWNVQKCLLADLFNFPSFSKATWILMFFGGKERSESLESAIA